MYHLDILAKYSHMHLNISLLALAVTPSPFMEE